MHGGLKMEYTFPVNGFEVRARYDESAVNEIFVPLLEKLGEMRRKKNGRLTVFLAAPPAVGKSTLAAFLELLSGELKMPFDLQALGMDGFHYHQDYILTHTVNRDGKEVPMKSVKGAPESFDLEKLAHMLECVRSENVKWPFYDRRLHDVVEDAVPVTGDILLIEGNWLLLDEPGWKNLGCDFSIFVGAEEHQLRNRLIDRKMRGGLSRLDAEAFYDACDGPNIRRCMEKHKKADISLTLLGDGRYRVQ
ncbi:MAG: nucleoside/nucleotide kinase family protein [Clostridia bacterium]|nr:nucleoside/nucleotide kinase family protein [Clostridia bacterium]